METVRQRSLVWSVKETLHLGSMASFQLLAAADFALKTVSIWTNTREGA